MVISNENFTQLRTTFENVDDSIGVRGHVRYTSGVICALSGLFTSRAIRFETFIHFIFAWYV